MTTACTGSAIYWGEGGEYGPFDEQQTGEWARWPDFGQVLRYFREKAELSPKEFVEIYGRSATKDGGPISERQLRRMENQNQVPPDMNKRKLIARLLNIPPALFGLAALEHVTLQPHPKIAGATRRTGQTKIVQVVADTTRYRNNIETFWVLHDTSEAYSKIDQISTDILDLESLESQARGDLLYHIHELLFSYHILAAHVVRDQREFSLSHYHANEAVRVAMAENDCDLIATARYTRGCTYLEWGMFGVLANRVFQVQEDKIRHAIRDFEDARRTPENGEEGLHPQLLGFIRTHLSRALTVLKLSNGEKIPATSIIMLESATGNVENQNIDDPYQRLLLTGHRQTFTLQALHTNRASIFNVGGMADKALQEVTTIESLQHSTLERDLTRQYTWLDIVAANAHMGLRQFKEVTRRAKRAVLSSRDIKSLNNLTSLIDIHGRLLQSTYRAGPDVKELGDMIHEIIADRLKQENKQVVEVKDY